MDQTLPRHFARRRRAGHARSLARDSPDARDRGAAEDRCQRGDAARRRAGGNPHRAGETKPNARSRAQLDIVPQANEGTLDIAVPIDIPFPEVSRLIEAQLKGKTFPEDGSGSFATTIKQAVVAASGDRLLISLLVNVKKRGFFSARRRRHGACLGEAGARSGASDPALHRCHARRAIQAAFGLLGEAAQAAVPYLQRRSPSRRSSTSSRLPGRQEAHGGSRRQFHRPAGGLTADVNVNALRLTGIAYDDKTLRVIADADGQCECRRFRRWACNRPHHSDYAAAGAL